MTKSPDSLKEINSIKPTDELREFTKDLAREIEDEDNGDEIED